MSFQGKKSFEKVYKSMDHFLASINRNQRWNVRFTASGKAASDALGLIVAGASVTLVTTATGSKVGFIIGGPKGAAIGAGVGCVIGLGASALVFNWYVKVEMFSDGRVRASYAPV